jgi:hypothetical protein
MINYAKRTREIKSRLATAEATKNKKNPFSQKKMVVILRRNQKNVTLGA